MSYKKTLEIAEAVLKIIYTYQRFNGMSKNEIYGLLVRDFRDLDGDPQTIHKLRSILKTLQRDNLIYSDIRIIKKGRLAKREACYFLSMDGEFLVERGGYNKKLEDIKKDETRLSLQFWFNIILAFTSIGIMVIAWLEYKKEDDIKVINKLLISIKAKRQSEYKQDTSLNYHDSLKRKTK